MNKRPFALALVFVMIVTLFSSLSVSSVEESAGTSAEVFVNDVFLDYDIAGSSSVGGKSM
ncbi:hypothetical protein FACS189492_1240 [Clostridia bacterium]|nr:hypothetical protein FACS189492_1240 [Clostridia bacterium]